MQNQLELRTKSFAPSVVEFIRRVTNSKITAVLEYQLLKSVISVGANCREAVKNIYLRNEAAETEYWLELFWESNAAPAAKASPLLTEIRELLAIFDASGKTAKSHS